MDFINSQLTIIQLSALKIRTQTNLFVLFSHQSILGINFQYLQQVIMTTVQEELASVEALLKKYAQELGELNLSNNRLQESNQELSIEIQRLQAKITKKSHNIQQQAKDKQIIHQKLVKAQQLKEELQIQYQRNQTKKQQQVLRNQFEHERQASRELKKEVIKTTPPVENKNISIQQPKKSEKTEQKLPIKQETQLPPVAKPAVTPLLKQQSKPVSLAKVEEKQSISSAYDNSEKGDYQPPALFQDQSSSGSDDEDNSGVLQKLKQKLKQDRQEMDDDD